MSTLIRPSMFEPPIQAALINLGDSPLIGLIVLIIIVGIAVAIAIWLLDHFGGFIAEPFRSGVRFLIYLIAGLIVLSRALEVLFGISLGV